MWNWILFQETVEDDSEEVNQSNLSALVEVIRSAGFHVSNILDLHFH